MNSLILIIFIHIYIWKGCKLMQHKHLKHTMMKNHKIYTISERISMHIKCNFQNILDKNLADRHLKLNPVLISACLLQCILINISNCPAVVCILNKTWDLVYSFVLQDGWNCLRQMSNFNTDFTWVRFFFPVRNKWRSGLLLKCFAIRLHWISYIRRNWDSNWHVCVLCNESRCSRRQRRLHAQLQPTEAVCSLKKKKKKQKVIVQS